MQESGPYFKSGQEYTPPSGSSDATEVEQRLRESEERWRSLVASSMDAVLMTSPDGRVFSANPAATKLFGYSEQELIEKGRNAVVDGSDPRLTAALEQRARTGRFHGELTLVRKDGSKFEGEISTVLFTGFHHEPCTSMVVRDISERNQVESALRASEAALRAKSDELAVILDATPAITFIAHDRDCRYMTSSSEAMKTLRLPPGANTSKSAPEGERPETFRVFRHGRELLPEELPVQQSASTGRVIKDVEVTLLFTDGSTRELVGNSSPIRGEDGQIRGAVGAFLDITERRQAEQKIRESEASLRELAARLEQIREEERARIASAIHDELGHALTDMKLDLAWIDRRLNAQGLRRQTAIRQRLAQVIRNVDGLAQGVRRIATELRPAVLDALGLLPAIEWQAQEFQRQTGIHCRVASDEGGIPVPFEQSTALFRALQELLTNIVKHAAATQVVIHLAVAPEQVVLEVTDNGRGFPANEPFCPTALGLLSIRERAAALGGVVQIESAPGKGAKVAVKLPVDRSTDPS